MLMAAVVISVDTCLRSRYIAYDHVDQGRVNENWKQKPEQESASSSDDSASLNKIPVRDGIPLFDPQECAEPMTDWQETYFPNCNLLHSIDMTNGEELELLGIGGQRMVWKHHDQAVFKTMRWKNSRFKPRQYDHVRIDAILSERLTSSPYVMDLYGHCGLSTLNEMGKPERHWQRGPVSARDKLDLSRQLAHAVADLHDIDGANVTTAIWRNMKPGNVLFVNGQLKINDFDDSILVRRNVTSNQACTFQLPTAPFVNKTFQPPELCYSGKNLDEKIDIYSLGFILYQILTRSSPYVELREDRAEINRLKRAGILPNMTLDKRDPVELKEVVEQCMALDPKSRPTARQVAEQLDRAYERLPTTKTKKKSE